MKLEDFLNDLGSKKGAPGGGAAAALTGAAGAALVEMTSRLNDARQARSSGNAVRAAALRKKLQGMILKDAKAFDRIKSAYKSRKTKPALWQKALKAGAEPPLRICELCATTAVLAKNEKSRTSPWLESDRKESLILLEAAFRAAELNVEINLKGLKDGAYGARTRKKIRQWRQKLQRY